MKNICLVVKTKKMKMSYLEFKTKKNEKDLSCGQDQKNANELS